MQNAEVIVGWPRKTAATTIPFSVIVVLSVVAAAAFASWLPLQVSIVTVFLFAVWIIVLDARAGVMQVPPSLIEMGRCYGASRFTIFTKIIVFSALPEILAGIRIGLIRGVKGVVIGQILVSIIGYGELFELYSRSFDMERFWALTMILFAAAMLLSAAVEHFEKRIEYYAGAR